LTRLVVIQKPAFGEPCNRCGLCCREEACDLAEMVGLPSNAPCGALEVEEDGLFSCGILKHASKFVCPTWSADDRAQADAFWRKQLSLLWTGRCCSEDASV
jgi:hypothetical protein